MRTKGLAIDIENRRRLMKWLRPPIFLLPVLLPCILAAQDAEAPKAPKLVPALGWDTAKQGGFATCVAADAQNTVWVGTEGNGLWSYDARKKSWTQFTVKDGLGDDCIYALAVDKLGRVWAGHLNHGVSVWNGEKWRNYGVTDGPLGSRVFAIATCPTDGDVWIATELGVARYSIADDDWDYFTRASGLPSNQVQAIAFDAGGNIYLGTQCDGIAMADAKNKYQKWVVAQGLPEMQNSATGAGLASSLINDLTFVTQPQNARGEAGELFVAATPLGISVSGDYGDRFSFIRGEDWQDNVKGLLEVPDAPNPQPGGPVRMGGGSVRTVIRVPGIPMVIVNGIARMGNVQQGTLPMEDWVTCVHAEKENGGRLWIGYRNKGLEIRSFGAQASVRFDTGGLNSLEIRSIWTGAKTPALIAVYDGKDGGLKTPDDPAANLDAGDPAPQHAPALPSPAKAPASDDIEPLVERLGVFKNELKPGDAVFIGDDWSTGGDWVGRYGTSYAMLNTRDRFESEADFTATVELGPHHNEGESAADHDQADKTDDPRVLYYPTLGARHEAEINDRSWEEAYPATWEGPDLWLTVKVPKGIQILSLYFQNYDAHTGSENKLRDYDIQILQPLESQKLTLKEAPLARARRRFLGRCLQAVCDFRPRRICGPHQTKPELRHQTAWPVHRQSVAGSLREKTAHSRLRECQIRPAGTAG